MSEQTLQTLTRRLDRLERKVRLWRILGGFSAALAFGLLVPWGAVRSTSPAYGAGPRVVEAERFVLRDASGRSGAVLDISAGKAGLTLKDEQEVPRVLLAAGTDAALVGLASENGKPRLMLTVSRASWGVLLEGENEKAHAALTISPTGSSLRLENATGTSRAEVSALGTGSGVSLGDKNEEIEVGLVAGRTFTGFLMKGKQHERGEALLTFNEGAPVLFLSDRFQTTRVAIGGVPRKTGNVWGLNAQDSNGQPLLALP